MAARTVLSRRFTSKDLLFDINPGCAGLRLRAWFWTPERCGTRYFSCLHGLSPIHGILSLLQFQVLLSVVAMVWVGCARMARNRRLVLLQRSFYWTFTLQECWPASLQIHLLRYSPALKRTSPSCFQRSLTVRTSALTWLLSMYICITSPIANIAVPIKTVGHFSLQRERWGPEFGIW